jgi:hypothetical protein
MEPITEPTEAAFAIGILSISFGIATGWFIALLMAIHRFGVVALPAVLVGSGLVLIVGSLLVHKLT